jgi:hypothetical protein
MLTNIITKNSILSKFEIVAISTIFISQKAVKARIIANALHFSLLILKKIFSWIFFLKKASEICVFLKKVWFDVLWHKNQRMYENEQIWRFGYFSQYFRYTTITRKILNCGAIAYFFASLILEKWGTFFRICRIVGYPPK